MNEKRSRLCPQLRSQRAVTTPTDPSDVQTHSWKVVRPGQNPVLSDSKGHAFSAEEYHTRPGGRETNINYNIEIELQ